MMWENEDFNTATALKIATDYGCGVARVRKTS